MAISKEAMVGFFVVIGLICLGYLTIKLGKMELFNTSGYSIFATFSSVSGLKPGAEVDIAGVKVGRVKSIQLDKKYPRAIVELHMDKDIQLTEDAIASVKTSGLIGDKYISITPGGSGEPINNGGEITDTESSIDIESLISKYIFGKV